MSNQNPLVSVLMTAYNREKYIAEAIKSVLENTYSNFELIVIDDGSIDNTVKIAKQYVKNDARVQVYINENNLGDYFNRHKAATLAKGKYLQYTDSDDMLYPHALDVYVRYMEMFPEAGLGISKLHTEEKPLPEYLQPKETYQRHFLVKTLLSNAPGSVIIKKEAYFAVGGFSGLRYCGDREMWLKLAAKYSVVLLPGQLGWTRTHEGQEKGYDIFKYQLLTMEVSINALRDKTNPLSDIQTKNAITRLKHHYTRNILFGLGLKKFKFATVIHFIFKARIGLSSLIMGLFPLKKYNV